MQKSVCIVGGGLAGSEAALQLASRGISVKLFEMRPNTRTAVHKTDMLAELVCSNSFKSKKTETAAGMLKAELEMLGSHLLDIALRNSIDAGGALAVDRQRFAHDVTSAIASEPNIELVREEVTDLMAATEGCDAVVVATGPLTSDGLASQIENLTGSTHLAFYDAAAPIVMADSIDMDIAFRQSRYEGEPGSGDYINCPFDKKSYESFINELVSADLVLKKDFETQDLFQGCQPIEEIARKGHDAPRFGPMKPVGLTDPRSGRRPWAAVQLRAEDAHANSFNLVGFQTNLTFPEQKRVFRMIPGLENAEFSRFGVMHRNTFIDAPHLLNMSGKLVSANAHTLDIPVYVAGQLAGTEGYTEAIMSGLHVAISIAAEFEHIDIPELPQTSAFGALMAYATDGNVKNYQPMHVNFGIMPPLDAKIKNKRDRYAAYAERGKEDMRAYVQKLKDAGLLHG